MLTRFRKVAYIMAYAVATIPLWHYIRDGRILALMVAVVTFAYINVVLSTVEAAQPILTSEKAKTPLPRWLPNKPKYHKWWLLVRHILRWHLLLIPPKMGLALGFVYWLHITEITPANSMLTSNLADYIYTPYLYVSHNGFPVPAFPQWQTMMLGAVVVILFTILEGSLIAALGMMLRSPSRIIIVRLMIACCAIGIMSQYQVHYDRWISGAEYCANYDCIGFADVGNMRHFKRQNMRIGDTVHVGFLTTNDMGVLLSANIMRPIGEQTYFAARTANGTDEHGYPIPASWDNRLYVARQIVAGMLGLLLYAGATWVVLWFVEDEGVSG